MGDPACWLHATCPDCGLLDPDRRDDEPCHRCGAAPNPATPPDRADEDRRETRSEKEPPDAG